MTSQEKYIQKLDDMFASAVSVVFTPSREPRRTVEAVKAMGARDNVPVFVWNDVYGWKVFTGQDRTVGVPVDADSPVGNFYQALRRILGFKIGENTSNASSRFDYEKGAAYIVMEGTSPHLGLLPMTTTLLKDYAYSFPETLMSLVLITSESYTIPEELAHDILVVDFDLPTKTDLRHAWESTVANQYESKNLPIPETYIPGDSVDALVNAASGMTILEAETAYSRAFTLNDRLFPDIPVENLLAQVHRSKEDIVKKSQTLEMVNPIPVDSIGGLELLKDWFITRSVCFSEEARKAKVDAPKGVALIGPPGCIAAHTVLRYRRGKRNSSRQITAERLYARFNGLEPNPAWSWDNQQTYLHSYDANTGRVMYNRIEAVTDAGEKECLRITLSDGSSFTASRKHPVLTPEGFKPLQEIAAGDTVLSKTNLRPRRAGKKAERPERKTVEGLKYYSSGWRHAVNGCEYRRQHRSRLVVEASMNRLDYDEFVRRLKTDPSALCLKVLGREYDVHHIDGNPMNDRLDNLLVIHRADHKTLHHHSGQDKFNIQFTKSLQVVAVEDAGVQHCFDIQMAQPFDNFCVESGLIVHNTGKSVCSKAVASILNLPLVRVDLGRLFGSLVGQTEARTRTMLKELEAMAPCIVWVDEVDKAGLSSGANGDSGVSSRLLGSLLTHMSENESGLFWIFTANRTENLPSEFLRKGRLDEVFSVLPPTWAERRQIFDIHLSKRGINIDDIADFDQVLTESRGFVSAEIEAACKEAKVLSFYRNVPVTSSLLRSTLKGIIPISEAYKDQFDAMTEWAQNNARPSSEQEVDVDASSPLPSSIPESLRTRRRRH